MSNEDQQEPAVMEVTTISGVKYDANNIPGKVKAQLVADGQIDADRFIAPANMPGSKLAALRADHADKINARIKAESKERNKNTEFIVGQLVRYNNSVVEIQKVGKLEEDKKREEQLLVPKREGGTVWVHISKVDVLGDEELAELEKEE